MVVALVVHTGAARSAVLARANASRADLRSIDRTPRSAATPRDAPRTPRARRRERTFLASIARGRFSVESPFTHQSVKSARA